MKRPLVQRNRFKLGRRESVWPHIYLKGATGTIAEVDQLGIHSIEMSQWSLKNHWVYPGFSLTNLSSHNAGEQ